MLMNLCKYDLIYKINAFVLKENYKEYSRE